MPARARSKASGTWPKGAAKWQSKAVPGALLARARAFEETALALEGNVGLAEEVIE